MDDQTMDHGDEGDARGLSLQSREVTVRRIREISFLPMSAKLRNQLIIQAYGDMAEEMARVLGTEDASWANLGAWASNEVGGYLDLPIPIFGGLINRHFGDGNRDVFADVGRAHAVFLETVGRACDEDRDLDRAWDLCDRRLRFRAIEPPGRPRGDGQRVWDSLEGEYNPRKRNNHLALRASFRAYSLALQETDPDERSRRILEGNAILALHEQRHLSLPISLGFRVWLRTLLRPGWPLESTREWMDKDPGWRIGVEDWWIKTATKRLIGIQLPDEKIHVRDPVPLGDRPVPFTPDAVPPSEPWLHLDSAQDTLTKLWHEIDIDGRPATFWNSLPDRVAYIAELFRQQQRSDRWWADRDNGTILRPPVWDDFETELAAQIERMAEPVITRHVSPGCPHDDDYLDLLRTRRSEPRLPDGDMEFSRLHDPERRAELTALVEDDFIERLDAIAVPGGLFDPVSTRRARDLFDRWHIIILMGLLFRSLPDAYAARDGAKVIGRGSDLATDAFRRVGETAHFIQELLHHDDGWNDESRLVRDGEAWESIVGLRGLHALVSAALTRRNWPAAQRGEPVNQEDMLGTALSFVVPVFELMDDLGAKVDDEDRTAYLNFWLGVGHLLGAPIEAVTVEDRDGRRPLSWDEAIALSQAIRRRHHHRSLDGVRLTEALIEGVADGFPRPIRSLAPGLMQALGDPTVTALLMARTGEGRRRADLAAKFLETGLRIPPTRPLTRWLIQLNGRRILKPFLDAGTAQPYRKPFVRGSGSPVGAFNVSYWPVGKPGQRPSEQPVEELDRVDPAYERPVRERNAKGGTRVRPAGRRGRARRGSTPSRPKNGLGRQGFRRNRRRRDRR